MSGSYSLPTTPKGQLSSETPATFFAKLKSDRDEKQDKDDKKGKTPTVDTNTGYPDNINYTPPVVPFPSPNFSALTHGANVGVAVAAIMENGVVPTFTNESPVGRLEPSLTSSPSSTDSPATSSPSHSFATPLSQRRKALKATGSPQSSPEIARVSNNEGTDSHSPPHMSFSQRRKKPRLSADGEDASDDSMESQDFSSIAPPQHCNLSLRRKNRPSEVLPDITCPQLTDDVTNNQPVDDGPHPTVEPSEFSDNEAALLGNISQERPVSLDSSHSPTRDSIVEETIKEDLTKEDPVKEESIREPIKELIEEPINKSITTPVKEDCIIPTSDEPTSPYAPLKSASIAFLCSSDDVPVAVPEPYFHYPSIHGKEATKMEADPTPYALSSRKSQAELEMEAKTEADVRIGLESESRKLRSSTPIDIPAADIPKTKSKRKRAKNEVTPLPPSALNSDPASSAVSHRLRSSTKRPTSPTPLDSPSSPDHPSRPGKVSKRKQQPSEQPNKQAHHRSQQAARHRHHSPQSSAPPSPIQSPLPEPLSPPQYPHLPHPPLMNSFSYPLHGAPHRVPEPYIFAYTNPTFMSPPSPPHAPTHTSAHTYTNNTTASISSPSRKVPTCTRCNARAAWKHDKKGKRWFCKICKLPFTPGVSPAHQKKDVITIPPCPKCYSNEGWKQDKGKYFCTHCKQSFRPRIARGNTRSSARRGDGDKKDDSYDGEEDEEGYNDEVEEEAEYDSDFGTNAISPFTPDLETNYPYYRGDNKYMTRKMTNGDGANSRHSKTQTNTTIEGHHKQAASNTKPVDHSFHQVPNFIQPPSYQYDSKEVEPEEDSFDNEDVTQILLGMKSGIGQ